MKNYRVNYMDLAILGDPRVSESGSCTDQKRISKPEARNRGDSECEPRRGPQPFEPPKPLQNPP